MTGKRILVVFFSRTGHTRLLADEIAAGVSAVVEQIRAPTLSARGLGVVRLALAALFRRQTAIEPPREDPARFDLVVIGSPVWAGRVSTPVRSYITRHATRCAAVAAFVSAGGTGVEAAFADIERLSGRVAIARLGVSDKDRVEGIAVEKTQAFIDEIENWLAQSGAVKSAEGRASRSHLAEPRGPSKANSQMDNGAMLGAGSGSS